MSNRKFFISFILCLSLSVSAFSQQTIEQWNRFEVSLQHNYKGNPFKEVQLQATFTGEDTTYTVTGFYDGNNTFKIRFMPLHTGTWRYITKSNVGALNNRKGSFECVTATGNNHGQSHSCILAQGHAYPTRRGIAADARDSRRARDRTHASVRQVAQRGACRRTP